MCDHCKTFKPLLEGTNQSYEKNGPIIHDTTPRIPERTSNPGDKGCCAWRRGCCGGGCCDRIGNCCTGSESPASIHEKPSTSYGYGYGYRQPSTRMMDIPFQMTDVSVERVPCVRQEKKLPMCFGGDCKDSEDEKCENDVSEAPRQSER